MQYPVAIQQRNQVFHAHLPDMPELNITCSSMADSISKTREVVMNHLQQLIEEEKSIPKASQISNHLIDPKYAGWTWSMVIIDVNRVAAEEVKLKVKIPKRLDDRLQEHLTANNIVLKEFIIDIIKKALD